MGKFLNKFLYKEKVITLEESNKAEPHTLNDLALDEHSYWKFSQTKPGRSVEGVFTEYKENTIVEAKDEEIGLSFVPDDTIMLCYMYGDQLTNVCMDINNPLFIMIGDNPISKEKGVWKARETRKLIVEKNYSLRKKETIRLLISMIPDNKNLASTGWFYGGGGKDEPFKMRLESFGFNESAKLIAQLRKMLDTNNCMTKQDALEYIDDYKEF